MSRASNLAGFGSYIGPPDDLYVGIVTAVSYYGDGSNLSGITAGATLSAASGSQRIVVTSLTSGTMTSAGTDGDLAYNASTNTLSATNFSGALSGNATSATNASNIGVADESSDTTCFPLFATGATGNQAPKTNSSLTYNSSTGQLTAVDLNATSDINLKKDIETITSANEILNQINGVRFTWKDNDRRSLGVIAQEIEAVLPELISERTDTGTKSVNYNGLIGVLIEAVKELSQRVEELEQNK